MKIERIASYEVELGLVLGAYKSAVSTIDRLTTTVVRLDTDTGLTGWGEVCPYGANYLPAMPGAVQPVLKELANSVLGKDPRDTSCIDAIMDRAVRDQLFVKTAVDYACWDILGKATGLPVSMLLGGRLTDRLPLIASIPGGTEEMQLALSHYREKGYRQFSFHVSDPSVANLRVYRDVIGELNEDDIAVVDSNRSLSIASALEMARYFRGLPISLEQPCADIAQCAAVRSRVDFPIVLDESIVTPADVVLGWQCGAVDSIALKIGRCGGLTKVRRICDLADTLGLTYWVKDVIGAEIVTAATAQFAHSRSTRYLAGTLCCTDIVDGCIATTNVRTDDGTMFAADSAPGLGVEPDLTALGPVVSEFRL